MEQLRMICKMRSIPEFKIEDGYTIRNYRPGDEVVWTKICKFGLLEENEGIECWQKYMLDLDNLVPERDTFFACDKDGNPVATCTAFVPEKNTGLIHMVGALPESRGHYLGYSLTVYGLEKLNNELSCNNKMVCLKSDDWRLSALKIYLKCGFQPVLFDVGMEERWTDILNKLDIHGVEMLDDNGNETGIIL